MTRELILQAIESSSKLIALQQERVALLKQLDRSLYMELLWPGVFKQGLVRSSWIGVVPEPWRTKRGEPEHKHHSLRVTAGDGVVRYFAFDEVPELLGGGRKI